jgi:arginyl-tRNA synthetase
MQTLNKKRAQKQVVLLQGGDPAPTKAWKLICNISRKAFEEIYDLLDVKLVERGESFYNPYLKPLIEDLEKKGLITISDGAKCIFMEGFFTPEGEPLPMIVQKSDGGTTTRQILPRSRYRIDVDKAERILYVVMRGRACTAKCFSKLENLRVISIPKRCT